MKTGGVRQVQAGLDGRTLLIAKMIGEVSIAAILQHKYRRRDETIMFVTPGNFKDPLFDKEVKKW